MSALPTEPARRLTPAVLLTLAMLGMLSTVSIDMLLPVLPAMADEFGASASQIQLTMTGFLVGVCVGQLIFGPLSDAMGRRTPVLIGLALFLAATAISIVLGALPLVLVARLVQGIGAGAGMVVGRAVVSDLTHSADAARAFSIFMLIVGLGPILTPLAGSVLGPIVGWRGVYAAAFAFAVVATIASATCIPVDRPRSPPASASAVAAEPSIRRLPRLNRRFLGFAWCYALGFAAIMANSASLPFIYQTLLGMREIQYGLLIALNATGMLVAGLANALIVRRFGPVRIARAGLIVFLGTALATAVVVFAGLTPAAIVPLMLIASTSFGMIMGNVTALTITALPGHAGTASALQGALQYLVGGLIAPLVGLLGASSTVPFAIVFALTALLSLTAFLIAARDPGQPTLSS